MNEQYIEDSYPLSPLQQGMLFHDLYAPHSGLYLQQLVCTLHEKLNVTAFKKAWQRVMARHPVLRTSFHLEGFNEPLQRVHKHFNLRWVEEDCRAMTLSEQNHQLETYLQKDRQQGFKLTEAPLMRLALFQVGDADYRFIWTSHHAIKDGRSRFILLKEVFSFYEAFCLGKDIIIKHPRPYKDYIDWLTKEDFNKAQNFWRQMLEGVSIPAPIVVDSMSHSTSDKTWEEYDKQKTRLSGNFTRAMQSVAKQHGLTPNTILQGAWALLWSRYSGEQEVVFGATRACRRSGIKGVESMVGLFINNLPVRISVTLNTQLLPWLQEIRSKWVAMRDYEHTPIIEIQRWNDIPAGTPLFESILTFEYNDFTSVMQAQGGRWINREFESITYTNFPISVIGYLGSELLIEIIYNRRRFEDETIARMLGHIEILLESIIANPEQHLSDVPMLTEPERRQILVDWNNTSCGYPGYNCLHELFEQQVEQSPDSVAVVHEDEQLSYRELNTRSNQLAHYLKKLGVGPEVLVAICIERSLEMVVALMGILKAGGAYVPLDPDYPSERLAFMLSDAQILVLLTQKRLVDTLPLYDGNVICLDNDMSGIAQESEENPTSGATPDNLVYVIYTSGSTGGPKGVLIPHRALLNHSLAVAKQYGIGSKDRVLQFASISFDLAAEEIFPTLLSGATVVLHPDQVKVSFTELLQFMEREQLTVLNPPTAYWHEWVSELSQSKEQLPPSVRLVIPGGEKASKEKYAIWQKLVGNHVRWINGYGPTEATITATNYEPTSLREVQRGLSVPIGRPIANTRLYILNAHMQPAPIGVYGELHIGGAGLSRGYLNRPELTAEKFIPNPFSEDPAERLYKTGDLARYLPDGNIEFLGRIDHQVKIRGFRIELGEIEGVLGQHPAVEEAVVIAREDVPGEKRLVGYVVPAQEPLSPSVLRRYLQQRIPNYMVPAHFAMLDALPLTTSGKVDRRDLPAPDGLRPELDTVYQIPRGGVEQTLAQIWKQVLRIDQVGRQDNFFELGGDSILSIQIVAKTNQAGLRVTPQHLFQYQTIAELAELVQAREPVAAEQGVVTGQLPLSPIQHWFFGQPLEAPHHWNMAWVLEAKQPVDPKKMEQVVETLLRHHDALRLRFISHNTGWKQELGTPNLPIPFTFIDLSHLPYAEAAAAYRQEADRLHTTLNLSEGPLIQVALFKFSENQADRVLLVIHHLAVDGISWRILLEDLQTAYDQLCERGSIQLPPKTTSFKEWTEGLVAYAQSHNLHEEVSYWGAVANSPCTHFPRDFVDGINTVASTRAVSVGLGPEDTQALLQKIPEVYHTQINDVLLAALVDVLAQWSQQETMCLALEGHGREELLEDIDLSRTVGWFTSIFPVVFKWSTPGHAGELLKSVKEQLRQIPHRGIGYGLLRYLREGGKVRAHLGNGLDPELSFNYLGQFDQVIAKDGQWRWSEAPGGANRHPQDKQTDLISINARIMNSVLQVQWRYSEAVHRRETIENLAQDYLATLVTIIRHCQSPEAGGYTPSDFPLAKVSQSDLDKALIGTKSGDGKAVLTDLYALTPLQQGLWFHTLVNPESGVYFKQSVFHIEGYTNHDVLRQAWEKVVAQHAILRTGIIWEGLEHPLQFVWSTVELPWAAVDWRESTDNEHQSRLLKFLDEDRLRGFDLTQAPLMRLTLIQVAETSAILVWSFHHLILDRWSVDLVLQEVWSVYQTLVKGQPLQFNALRPYREYIGWLQDQDLNRAEQYWRPLLRGFTAPTVPGVDQAPPTRVGHQESSYSSEESTLSEAATSALSRWARQQQLTVNTLIQGAWALLLSRYSGSEDVVFGATVSGRSAGLPGIESMVGLFINTLPVRVHVSPNHSVVPWLTTLQEQQVTMREYEYTPLFEIQKWSEVPPGEPLFNTILAFENTPLESEVNLRAGTTGLHVQRVAGRQGGETNYPLSIAVIPGRTLQMRFSYDTEHYTAEAITRMVGHFQQVLTGMIRGREQTLLGAIPLLTETERQLTLVEWNATEATYPRDVCIHDLFEVQVEQTPDAVALVFEDQKLTYAELNLQANQLAHYLRKKQIRPEACIGISLPRGVDLVVAILGIWKAGGAYVPLDPAYPCDRIAYMLEDSKVKLLLTHTGMTPQLPSHDIPVVCIDTVKTQLKSNAGTNLSLAIIPDSLAYVMYTSGSTGTPKGVLVPHRGLANIGVEQQRNFGVGPQSRVLQFASSSFDASVFELVMALQTGGTLYMGSPESLRPGDPLLHFLREHAITVATLPPSALAAMAPEPLPALAKITVAGEACPSTVIEQWGVGRAFFNLYGPTEGTIWTTMAQCKANFSGRPPIGRPIANTQVYLLDSNLHPVPIGLPGELYIGGIGIVRGYMGRPELTAEKFVPHPFSTEPGARLYRTGDHARYCADGNLEFLGRIDHQVKLRGYRIELGEIEAVLARHPDVQEAVVVVREEPQGQKRLVGYAVSAKETVSPSELRKHLKQTLPEYMVPAIFMKLDALPLTPNGKVDRRALPVPEGSQPQVETDYVAPRSPYEEAVAEIWRDSLGLEQAGIYDNFFDLGGHSLLATKIVSRLKTTFAVDIPLRSFFDSPTIAEVSATLAMARRGEEPSEKVGILPVPRDGTLPLSFAQERFWVLDQFHANRAIFNGPCGFRLKGPFQFEVFQDSVQALVDRHEILRTTFASVDGGPHQVIAPTLSVEVSLQNFSDLSKEEQAGMTQQAFFEERRFQFDLAHGPLFRARLFRFAEDDHFLVLNFHHIILDAWSLEVIIKDLVTAYTAGCRGHAVALPALSIQYADYAHWQRKLLDGLIGREQLAFWKTQLAQLPPALPLPTDYARPAVQSFRGARESLQLPAELLVPLRVLNRQEGTTLFMVLLATLQFLLHRLTGTYDILVGSPIAGRDQQELQGLIGCFLNTLVLRTNLSGDLTGRDLLQRVREVVLNAYENQDVPFEKLLAEVDVARDLSRTPIFQVMLNMHSFDDHGLPLPELSVTRVHSTDINSLFDMTLYFNESTDKIQLSIVYNADLFTAGRMTEFMRQFQSILEKLINDPDQPLEAFTLVAPSTRLYLPDPQQPLDTEWEGPVWRRLEHHAHQQGEAIAMVRPGETWTYQELEFRSNQLAHCLLGQGVQAQEVVAIFASRSPELVLALFGILKAGAAFMILDPSYPSSRLLEMLQIAKPFGLIHLEEAGPLPALLETWASTVSCHVRLPAIPSGKTRFEKIWNSTSRTAPGVPVQPDDVAYVTFTSGTSGTPNCLRGTHRPLSHFLNWYTKELQLTAADRVTMFSGLAHDPLLRDVFTPVWNGGTLCIPDQEALASGRVGDWMNEQKITLMHLTPPLVDVLTVGREASQGSCTSLRYAVFGGERLRPVHLDGIKSLAPQAICVNGYGATETPQIMGWYVVPPEFPSNRGQVPIGQGIEGVQILVLNQSGQLAGIGELGEIYIRTPYLTLGYMNDEALTSTRFLPNPFRPEAGDRIYRTGDMGRLLPDGNIEFAGRKDFQVKIRGFRIEVGEIKVVLDQHPAIREVVVVPGEDAHGDRLLFAYLVINENPSPSISDIRSFLNQRLPEYMIPSAFVFLDALPRTTNGKVDHRALPAPDLERSRIETEFVAPRTQVEEVLAEIWSEVLGLERVGVHDNFFELGGHSLLATQVMSRARDNFEMELPLLRFFEIPTIAGLTELIETIRLNELGPQSDLETTTRDWEEGKI